MKCKVLLVTWIWLDWQTHRCIILQLKWIHRQVYIHAHFLHIQMQHVNIRAHCYTSCSWNPFFYYMYCTVGETSSQKRIKIMIKIRKLMAQSQTFINQQKCLSLIKNTVLAYSNSVLVAHRDIENQLTSHCKILSTPC